MLASDYEADAIISAVRALIGLVYQQKVRLVSCFCSSFAFAIGFGLVTPLDLR
jgi:hypothetical protein